MDKISLKILKLLNINSSLNWYQFNVLIPSISLDKFGESIHFLYDKKFVKKSTISTNEEENNFSYTFDTFFEITLAGKQFLESKKEESKKFKIQSVYVPIIVAFITSIITTLTAIWLSN